MNCNYTRLLMLVCIAILTSCGGSVKTEEGNVVFTREDFAETQQLMNPEEILMDDLLNPASFRVVRDSILVVSNQNNCEFMLELYSLNTLEPLAQLARRGNGPEDMLSCAALLNHSNSSQFGLQDWVAKNYYTVDLDSLLKGRLVPISKFMYSSEILETVGLCPMDEQHYIAYHMWYLDDKTYSSAPKPLAIYGVNEDRGKDMGDFNSFVASVNGALIFQHPESEEIWTLDLHRDRIQIYNDSLELIRTIQGPDNFTPQYTEIKTPAPITFIGFTEGNDYRAYSDYFMTDKHLYLVYEGNKKYDPEALTPVEIFKLDYQGNLVCRYQLDRNVYSISVDSSEEHLYCASRESVKEPPTLLKYTL